MKAKLKINRSIVVWKLHDKSVVFTLKNGEKISLENTENVEVFPYFGLKGTVDKNGICHLQDGTSVDAKRLKNEG